MHQASTFRFYATVYSSTRFTNVCLDLSLNFIPQNIFISITILTDNRKSFGSYCLEKDSNRILSLPDIWKNISQNFFTSFFFYFANRLFSSKIFSRANVQLLRQLTQNQIPGKKENRPEIDGKSKKPTIIFVPTNFKESWINLSRLIYTEFNSNKKKKNFCTKSLIVLCNDFPDFQITNIFAKKSDDIRRDKHFGNLNKFDRVWKNRSIFSRKAKLIKTNIVYLTWIALSPGANENLNFGFELLCFARGIGLF